MKPEYLLIPKLDKDNKRKEKYRPIFFMKIDAEILHKILSQLNLAINKKD